MIIQCTTVKASKVSDEKAAARLKSHLKYLQYRQHSWEREHPKDHPFFNGQSDHIDRCCIHQSVMSRRTGNIYYHCLLLSPALDERVNNWRQWTRSILHDLENRFKHDLNWYAIQHTTDTPHVHIVLQGTGRQQENGRILPVMFTAQDSVYLCERGKLHSDYEQNHFLTEQLRLLDQYDTICTDKRSQGQQREDFTLFLDPTI